jgi:cytochrome c oxidase subunit 2
MQNVVQSALDAAGIQAVRIENLWWLLFWVSVAVWVIVIGSLALAVRRANRTPGDHTVVDPGSDAARLRAVAIATGLTVVTLFGLLVASVVTGRAVAGQRDQTGIVINVKAYQWWWDFEYQHPDPSQRVRTSNELHLPLGRTAAINLTGNDVIHSFWVPSLHGKMDVIPGHEAYLWLRADKLGTFRGQCAEFCGVQHAHMAFTVVVESSDDFERWIQAQRKTANPPASPEAARGLAIIQQGACAMCHQVLGTQAGGRTAPDLTHLASRQTIAAGTLPMSRDNLLAWIDDPQRFKPGVRMPSVGLQREDLNAVVAYLEGLR